MFKDYYDNMRPGPTPERVLAICRIVNGGKYSANEIRRICQLKACDLEDNAPMEEGIGKAISAAEELGLISRDSAGIYHFDKSEDVISHHVSFRRFVQNTALSNRSSTFFKVTEWYIAQNEKVFAINKFQDLSAEIIKAGLDRVDENDVLGWRFWMRFLGIAYQYNKTLIPNMNVRIQDALQEVPRGTEMACAEMVEWIRTNMPEAASSCSMNGLSLAVSNGLRTLAEEEKIEIISTPDAAKVGLYYLDGAELNDFSKIRIKEAVYDKVD